MSYNIDELVDLVIQRDYDYVFRLMMKLTGGDGNLAEDCVQQGINALWNNTEKLRNENEKAIKNYWATSSRNAYFLHVRKNKRIISLGSVEDLEHRISNSSIKNKINREHNQHIVKLLFKLLIPSKVDTEILILSIVNKWPNKDIAEKLGLTEDAVKSRKKRVLKKIRPLVPKWMKV